MRLLAAMLCCAASVWRGPDGLTLRQRRYREVLDVSHSEGVLTHAFRGFDRDGHYFHLGRQFLRHGRTARLRVDGRPPFSPLLKVHLFSRSRYVGGDLRSLTLATRNGPGPIRIGHPAGDGYLRWAPDFFIPG